MFALVILGLSPPKVRAFQTNRTYFPFWALGWMNPKGKSSKRFGPDFSRASWRRCLDARGQAPRIRALPVQAPQYAWRPNSRASKCFKLWLSCEKQLTTFLHLRGSFGDLRVTLKALRFFGFFKRFCSLFFFFGVQPQGLSRLFSSPGWVLGSGLLPVTRRETPVPEVLWSCSSVKQRYTSTSHW